MGFYFHFAISLEKQFRKIKICQVTFSRKKKKLENLQTSLGINAKKRTFPEYSSFFSSRQLPACNKEE